MPHASKFIILQPNKQSLKGEGSNNYLSKNIRRKSRVAKSTHYKPKSILLKVLFCLTKKYPSPQLLSWRTKAGEGKRLNQNSRMDGRVANQPTRYCVLGRDVAHALPMIMGEFDKGVEISIARDDHDIGHVRMVCQEDAFFGHARVHSINGLSLSAMFSRANYTEEAFQV